MPQQLFRKPTVQATIREFRQTIDPKTRRPLEPGLGTPVGPPRNAPLRRITKEEWRGDQPAPKYLMKERWHIVTPGQRANTQRQKAFAGVQ